MNNPLVSVIVPCYKQAHFLPETLNAVLNQTYDNWECSIVDDGSPDNTIEVANSFILRDKRFKLVSQENQGLAMARNNGIAASEGYFILPLDSDDKIESTYIAGAIVNLTLNLIFIPKIGALGAALGTVCAEFMVTAIQLSYVRKSLCLTDNDGGYLFFIAKIENLILQIGISVVGGMSIYALILFCCRNKFFMEYLGKGLQKITKYK